MESSCRGGSNVAFGLDSIDGDQMIGSMEPRGVAFAADHGLVRLVPEHDAEVASIETHLRAD